MSVTHLLPGYNKHGKFDKMLLKAVVLSSAAIISRGGDTSMAKSLDTNL